MRELADGCKACGYSKVYCHCCRYMNLGPCCETCTHE